MHRWKREKKMRQDSVHSIVAALLIAFMGVLAGGAALNSGATTNFRHDRTPQWLVYAISRTAPNMASMFWGGTFA